MPTRFSVADPGTAYTAARTVLEVTADTTHILRILRAKISNESLTTDDRIRARFLRKTAAGTGTSRTPVDMSHAAGTFGGTARSNMTAEGTITDILDQEGVSTLTSYIWVATDPDEIIVSPGGIIGLEIDAPAASTVLSAVLVFEVVGALT